MPRVWGQILSGVLSMGAKQAPVYRIQPGVSSSSRHPHHHRDPSILSPPSCLPYAALVSTLSSLLLGYFLRHPRYRHLINTMVSTSTPFNSSLYTPSSSSSTLCDAIISDALIDPALLLTPMPTESPVALPSSHLDDAAAGETAINTSDNGISPAMDDTGTRISADMFREHL